MLKSPIRLSNGIRSWNYVLLADTTMLRGVPVVDHVRPRVFSYVAGDIDIVADTFELPDHGLVEGQPITFLEGGGLQTGQSASPTYYVKYFDKDHIQIATFYPGNTASGLTADPTGINYIQKRVFAKYVLLTNFGASWIAIRPTNDASYAVDPDEELVLSPTACHPLILNVAGFSTIAAESIGAAGSLRVTALENF
jgi:hypothetical protein